MLDARSIPYLGRRAGGRHILLVRPDDADEAVDQLEKYRLENRGWPPQDIAGPLLADGAGSISY